MRRLTDRELGHGKLIVGNHYSRRVFYLLPNWAKLFAVSCFYHFRRDKVPPNKLLILAQARTGSNLLVDLLNSHPNVFVFGEMFAATTIRNVRRPRIFAEGFCSLLRVPTCGFKVRISHLKYAQKKQPAEVLRDFNENGWRIIHLIRKDVLGQAISDVRLEMTGTPFKFRGEPSAPDSPLRLELDEVLKSLESIEENRHEESVALHGLPHYVITYEEDLADPARQRTSMNRLFAFLGLPPHEVSTNMVKLAPAELSTIVENYDEITHWFSRTKHAALDT